MRSMGLLMVMLLLSTFLSISTLPAASANDEAAAIGSSGYGDQLASWNGSSAGGYCS